MFNSQVIMHINQTTHAAPKTTGHNKNKRVDAFVVWTILFLHQFKLVQDAHFHYRAPAQ